MGPAAGLRDSGLQGNPAYSACIVYHAGENRERERDMTTIAARKYNVGGVLLDRPFKIRRLGHVGFNCVNMDAIRNFYVNLLGFRISDETGAGGFFARYGSDHHALVMFNKEVTEPRMKAGKHARHWRAENDINQISWQLSSVAEIWNATKYLKELESDIIMEGRGTA